MTDVAKRLAELSPDKRALLERLLADQVTPPAAGAEATRARGAAGASEAESLVLDAASPRTGDEVKVSYMRFYDTVTAQLNATIFGPFSFFLNYGFVGGGDREEAVVELPPHYINRNSAKLVLELIGDCALTGRRVLDVGCGRGGTVHILLNFFQPAAVTGLDLSSNAIAFCRATHRDPRARFFEGDAESLPFEEAAFDVVTNVESSHSYPNLHRFYAEVYRVLAPGGGFLYTDALAVPQLVTAVGFLRHIGFTIERDRDITADVLRSCDEIARTRMQAFDGRNDQGLMQNFLGAPGSEVYENMRSGRWTYRILTLRKPGPR